MAEAANTARIAHPTATTIAPGPRGTLEINLNALAKDMSKLASGLSALGELVRESNDMQSDDWNVLYSGVGDLVEVLGDYANDLAERGFTIYQNLKVMEEQRHG